MTNIIETKFGTLVNAIKIAVGSASNIKKLELFIIFLSDLAKMIFVNTHLQIWPELNI